MKIEINEIKNPNCEKSTKVSNTETITMALPLAMKSEKSVSLNFVNLR